VLLVIGGVLVGFGLVLGFIPHDGPLLDCGSALMPKHEVNMFNLAFDQSGDPGDCSTRETWQLGVWLLLAVGAALVIGGIAWESASRRAST
jgi:hypothetical protein